MVNQDIESYNNKQTPEDKLICDTLMQEITAQLDGATNKVRHAHPVWFLDGNPIVGYSKQKKGICLLFWSGQSFDEINLKPEGTFKAAEIHYNHPDQISLIDLKRWIDKAKLIQRDYKNIVKRKGVLEKL